MTFIAAIVIGLVDNLITPINSITNYRDMTPFVLAVVALLFFARGRQYCVRARRDPLGAGGVAWRRPAL